MSVINQTNKKKTVLIVGAGFGGIRAALDLEKKLRHQKKWRILVIDKNINHIFTPSLYEMASAFGIKENQYRIALKSTICISHLSVFDKKRVDFIQGEVVDINLHQKHVRTRKNIFAYDYLIISLGSVINDRGVPGVNKHAIKLKDVNDGLMIHQKLEESFGAIKEGQRKAPVRVVIVGGGFTGVELAAELSCCAKHWAKRCSIAREQCLKVVLIEAGERILASLPKSEHWIVRKRLDSFGVQIFESITVKEIKPLSVVTVRRSGEEEEFETDLTVWSAGIKPLGLLKNIEDLPLSSDGKINVEPTLQVQGYENAYAIGDLAQVMDPENKKPLPIPAMAYVAIEEGKSAAYNIVRHINGYRGSRSEDQTKHEREKLKEYKPKADVWIIPVGAKFAVAHLSNRFVIFGFWGWVIRNLVDLRYFLSILPWHKALRLFFKDIILFSKND